MDRHGEPVTAVDSVLKTINAGFWPMKPKNAGVVQVGDLVALVAAGKDGKFVVATARVQVRETFNPKTHGRHYPLELEGPRAVCLVLADVNEFEEPKPLKSLIKKLSFDKVVGEFKKITAKDLQEIGG